MIPDCRLLSGAASEVRQVLPSSPEVKYRKVFQQGGPSMAVTRGLIIPRSALIQHSTAQLAKTNVRQTHRSLDCVTHALTCQQQELGNLMAEVSCGLYMFFVFNY